MSHGEIEPVVNPPLFPIDQTEFEASLAADHVNVEETARKLDRDEVDAAIQAISRAERTLLSAPTRWRSSPPTCATC